MEPVQGLGCVGKVVSYERKGGALGAPVWRAINNMDNNPSGLDIQCSVSQSYNNNSSSVTLLFM